MPEDISTADLEGIVESAAATIFDVQDSETSEVEEQPDEEVDEAEDLEVDDDSDDSDEEETEESEEDLEDEDDLDDEEEDDSEEEDDLEDEDSDEEEEDSDDDQDASLHTVKVQGQEFQVPLEELKAGYQRQQDYTLKTQQVSDIYTKMSQWYEQRANDPEFWVEEIVGGQEDPAQTIAGAIRRTGNATVLLGQTLKHLVESGEIADELVEALNLTQVAEQAKGESLHLKVESLQQQLQQRDLTAQQQAEHQAVEQEINRQWAGLGLQFEDAGTEHDAKVQLLTFARDKGIPNLHDAYVLMTTQAGDQATPAKPKTTKRKQASSAVKKRRTAAMSRTPTGGSSKTKSVSKKSIDPVQDAAAAALAELGLEE